MTHRVVRLLAGLLLVLGAPRSLWSQGGSRRCEQLPAGTIEPGQWVMVTLRHAGADPGATELRGRLLAVRPDTIGIESSTERLSISLRDVARIQRRRSVAKRVLTSMAIAGVATTLIDLGSGNPEPVSAFVVGGLFVGIPAAAIAGAMPPFGPPLCESP